MAISRHRHRSRRAMPSLMMRVYAEAARAGRLDQFYLFHLGYPEITARYNGIGNFARITEVADRATNALPASGNSAAFKEFAWRFTNLVAQAQVALGHGADLRDSCCATSTDIEPLFMQVRASHVLASCGRPIGRRDFEKQLRGSKRQVEQEPDSRSAARCRTARQAADRDGHLFKERATAGAVLQGLVTRGALREVLLREDRGLAWGPFLEKLTTGAVGKLISPDYFDPADKRPIFDWMQVIRQGGIVYVGLDALSDPVVAGAVGNSMLADLVSVGGKLYKTGSRPAPPARARSCCRTVCCHFDEVNELMGPEFVPMVNKIGGAGFMVHAYTQTIPDIEAQVGDAGQGGADPRQLQQRRHAAREIAAHREVLHRPVAARSTCRQPDDGVTA